jgi:hypothetical protein
MLTLDQKPPSIATATASPNPFEPRPHDGDRDTTPFACDRGGRRRRQHLQVAAALRAGPQGGPEIIP